MKSALAELKKAAKEYYRVHGRHHLPWRLTQDPYAILVSEMMLQQTQVERVIPYFERWMKKFPTPHALARSSLDVVLKEWSGLGYNRRAKYLHDAARVIVEQYGGAMPRSYDELTALPGVGDYTAKAVRVFAWNEAEVLIETNIRAVFIHHFFPRSKMVSDARLLPRIADALVRERPRVWYAALMDYGSHVKSTYPNPSRRSAHHTRQSVFKGSLREVRGAILRAYLAGSSLMPLRKQCGEKFQPAFEGLVREGLIAK